MLIVQQNGKVVVVNPIENSPAFRAGIHPGDVITSIDGQSANGMTSDDVANRLKGPRGTKVNVTMTRVGASSPLNFDLVRDEIPNASIDLSYEIRPGIGYLHIRQFQETTGREFDDAIESFGPGLKGLVLDLRQNPGGVLVEAVSVCDRLLKRGQIIVSQRGRAFPEQVYRATHGNEGDSFPIVVLVNRGTASAAEIVSGALQDHDRALIAGETTFGKGLVQTVYTLSDNTGLALTTYHYFTPSGRLIQRNYNGVSLYDYYYNHDQQPQDDKDREVKLTDSGRTVYGGGGITPDVKIESPKSTPFQDLLLERDAFLGFTEEYLAHRTVNKDFQVDDSVVGDFKQYLASQNYDYTPQELEANLDWVKMNVKASIFATQFGLTSELKVKEDWDPEVQQALGLMPQAAQLEQKVQQVLAQKDAALTKGPGSR